MSTYYNINGKKLRVSDHEPNAALRGSSDYYIWTKDVSGNTLSIGGQIDRLCDKYNLDIADFEKVIIDFADSDEECMYMLSEIKRRQKMKENLHADVCTICPAPNAETSYRLCLIKTSGVNSRKLKANHN